MAPVPPAVPWELESWHQTSRELPRMVLEGV